MNVVLVYESTAPPRRIILLRIWESFLLEATGSGGRQESVECT